MKVKKHPDIIVGQKFNKLTAIKQINRRFWRCQCECGRKRDVDIYKLWGGKAKCCNRCWQKNKLKPLTCIGQKFNHWTVLGEGKRRKDGARTVLCRCDCGNEVETLYSGVKTGRSRMCKKCANLANTKRPFRGVDITGMKFNHWTVLSIAHNDRGTRYWNVRCDCGFESLLTTGTLTHKQSKGCRRCDSKKKQRSCIGLLFNAAIASAELRGLSFELTKEYMFGLLEKQGFRCVLSGVPIDIASCHRDHNDGGTTASLDRIDSSKGYVEGNVQWVHKHINRMKWKHSEEAFIELCRTVAEHNPRPASSPRFSDSDALTPACSSV